jgi:hypothetical protein
MAGLTISPATTVMLKALKPGASAAIPGSIDGRTDFMEHPYIDHFIS